MVVNTQVPFDINYAQQFAVGTKICVGAVFDKKTLQHQWSGEACVKSVLLPLRYLKAAQADANSSYSLTHGTLLASERNAGILFEHFKGKLVMLGKCSVSVVQSRSDK